jgi:hypothetical protein
MPSCADALETTSPMLRTNMIAVRTDTFIPWVVIGSITDIIGE